MAAGVFISKGDPLPTYRAAVIAALEVGTGVTVYDGWVPEDVAEDEAGFVEPYVVLYSGDGDAIPERGLSGHLDLDSLRWDFQTTAVGASPQVCGDVGGRVRRTLTNLALGTYHILPSPVSYTGTVPVKDVTVNPARFMLPRVWRLDTT